MTQRCDLLAAVCLAAILLGNTPARAADKPVPLAFGETFSIDSKVLGETRRINVYRPPGSPAASRLPVLYLLDGGIAEDFLHIAGLVQVSVGNETMSPHLLVGIENTERRRDMTGPTQNAADRRIAPHVGESAAFRAFLRQELMPRINQLYRTSSKRAVVGESLAGLFVVETLLREPDLFDTYIAIDPSLWWNDQKLVVDAGRDLRSRPKLQARLFLGSSGEEKIPGVFQLFADVLQKNAPPSLHWHAVTLPEEKHATVYHPMALKAFREVFKPDVK